MLIAVPPSHLPNLDLLPTSIGYFLVFSAGRVDGTSVLATNSLLSRMQHQAHSLVERTIAYGDLAQQFPSRDARQHGQPE
jgi:hypothetical protein